ncbi:PLDc N-terminal domain-containing protein [Candidatus Woesearchaeota archaeon]|nr:PLDc N-terminal domain-containing protein [Candidatus Woesearchaeota archaeon]
MILFMFLMFAAVIALTVFWILMIIDCAKRKQLADSERIAWILVLVFLGFIGASVYYFAVKRAH